jgi:hypothetical protein
VDVFDLLPDVQLLEHGTADAPVVEIRITPFGSFGGIQLQFFPAGTPRGSAI